MSVVRHIVLLRFKPEADAAARQAALADLADLIARLVDRSPGVLTGSVGANLDFAPGGMDGALMLDVVDESAWRAYQDDADHKEFVTERLSPLLSARAAIQYEVAEP